MITQGREPAERDVGRRRRNFTPPKGISNFMIDTSQLPGSSNNAPTNTPTTTPDSTTTPQAQTPVASTGAAPAQQPNAAPGTSASPQTPQANDPTGTVSNAPAPVHPSVQRASVLRQVATALAGGPRYTETIDPQSGATVRTQVPLSGRDIGMAIALEALSGSIAGLAQRGPGAEGRATAAGFQQVSEQQQQAQKAQQDAAQQQYQNETQSLVRRANAYEANSRTVLNTAQAERYGVDSLKDAVSQNAQLLSDYQDQNVVTEAHVSQDDLSAGLASKKYDPTMQIAVPDGWTNINGKYEQTFSIVANPAAKVPLTSAQAKAYADAGVPGFASFKTGNVPNGVMVPGYMLAQANQRVQAINMMKSDFSAVSDALARSGDKDNQQLAKSIPNIQSLLNDKDNGPVLNNALGKFQKYVSHSDMHGMDLFESLQQMAAPSKPDPNNPKNFIPNPDSRSAQIIAGAFGGGDPQKGWDILRAYHDEVAPDAITNENQAMAVLADPGSSSKAKVQASKFLHISAQQKQADRKQGSESGASLAGNPALINSNPAGGVNTAYLQSLPTAQQQLVKAIAEGRTEAPNTRTKQGQELADMVTAYAPDYDGTRFHTYSALQKDFVSGKSSQGLQALNTALGHLGVIYDNANAGSTLPGVSGVERFFGNQSATNLKTAQTAVTDELGRAYKSGVVSEGERKEWQSQIDGWTPANVKASAASLARLLDSKIASYEQTLRNGAPSGAVRLPALMSPQAAAAYQHITGEAPTTSVGTNPTAVGVPTPLLQGQRPNEVPVIQSGQVIGYSLPGKQGMRTIAPFAAQ
jgi:hypothetical protein